MAKKKTYFTLTGTQFYHGDSFLEKDMEVKLVKDPDNDYDKEAIKVELEGVGQIGHVANSPYTVVGESISAGRLYDKIGDTADAKIKYIMATGILCTLED